MPMLPEFRSLKIAQNLHVTTRHGADVDALVYIAKIAQRQRDAQTRDRPVPTGPPAARSVQSELGRGGCRSPGPWSS